MLDGFPLALEVVLANLAHQTPAEVLAALQAGDVSIDQKSDSQDKTESILPCIDYSHSNLSPEAQQLLLCLAPFTSVIWLDMLDQYTDHLRQQPALEALPFDRWLEVIHEAQNWGLLNPDPEIPRFLRLQPIFPYFLRSHSQTSGLTGIRNAVEMAFLQHYDQIGDFLNKMLMSKDPLQRQVGQLAKSLEYENLLTALRLSLAVHSSVTDIYFALFKYLNTTQQHHQGLELGQYVLTCLETYPPEMITGP